MTDFFNLSFLIKMESNFQFSGKLIVFEGLDKCGKTTQLELTKIWLESIGKKVLTTYEPGDTKEFKLREILLHSKGVDKIAETLLFLADRAQHITSTIIPALQEGYIVLCDRFMESTMAYQGAYGILDYETLDKLNSIATSGIKSDLTIWIDILPELSLSRKLNRSDNFESRDIQFFHKVRQAYNDQYLKDIWSKNSRFTLINGHDNKIKMQDNIRNVISKRVLNV